MYEYVGRFSLLFAKRNLKTPEHLSREEMKTAKL